MAGSTSGPGVLLHSQLGHYRIEQKIGSGAMGEVYRARDEHLDREVAIKILAPGTLRDTAARRQFRREALFLSRLNHPNVATIHDFDTQQDLDYLVMEYIPGQTLRQRIGNGPLTQKEILPLGVQIADGLNAAHEKGIVHGDLKPDNLRLTKDGRLKILDFGLAHLRRTNTGFSETRSTQDSVITGGTLQYMAPEQLQGETADLRADIYATGCVLYEVATGHLPFESSDLSLLVTAVLHSSPVAPTERNPKISPELQRIILKCMEKVPDDRYQSANELAVDLQRLKRDEYLAHANPGGVDHVAHPRFSAKQKVAAASFAFLAVLLVFSAVRVWNSVSRPSSSSVAVASIAVLPFSDLSPNHDQEYFSDGLAEELISHLSKVPNLRVAARTSAFRFKGKNQDLKDIARELNVSNILDGSVRRDGDRVRVSAQLVKANDGFTLWSESYDREFKEILAVQDSVATDVAAALQLKLDSPRGPNNSPANPEAYEAFLRARFFGHMLDRDSHLKALEYANAAIRLDPASAPAYALRGDLVLRSGELAWTKLADATEMARADALKAISLNPDLPDGYRLLSVIQSEAEFDCPEAEKSLARATRLAPSSADNFHVSGMVAMCQGQLATAIESIKQELRLDPLRPVEYMFLAQMLRDTGKFEQAMQAADKALELNPNETLLHEVRGEIYLAMGKPAEALEEMKREPDGSYRQMGLALAYHALGKSDESESALRHLISDYGDAWSFQIAQVYAYRGEVTKAFEWLDRAYALRDPGLEWLKSDFKLKSLRGDARYRDLVVKVHQSG